MNCDSCGSDMDFQYEVEERNILFVLWDCSCGHKVLERKQKAPIEGAEPALEPAARAGARRTSA